jgi:hypothetical protein
MVATAPRRSSRSGSLRHIRARSQATRKGLPCSSGQSLGPRRVRGVIASVRTIMPTNRPPRARWLPLDSPRFGRSSQVYDPLGGPVYACSSPRSRDRVLHMQRLPGSSVHGGELRARQTTGSRAPTHPPRRFIQPGPACPETCHAIRPPRSVPSPSDCALLMLTWRSSALPDPARALTQKPCFDVFRSDAHSASLVHIASSTTRWSAIPLLPLPHARTASTPGNSRTSSDLGFSLEGSDAAAAQRAFELEVGCNGRASPSAAYGTSASSADDEEDDGADADRTQTHRHVCPRCEKRFNRPSSLVAHGRTHTGYKRKFPRSLPVRMVLTHRSSIRVPVPGVRPRVQRSLEHAPALQHTPQQNRRALGGYSRLAALIVVYCRPPVAQSFLALSFVVCTVCICLLHI